MIILGIDPGSQHTGYGVIEVEGGRERVIEHGVLNLDVSKSHAWRLKHIFDRVGGVIERCLPDECAIEMPIYGRNPQSMLKLGRAQAAAMLAALSHDIPVQEYTPTEVKQSVTGKGNASKQQVCYMVCAMLEVSPEEIGRGMDASDALAVALCHAHRAKQGGPKQHKDWASFLKANPGRVRR